jgi:alkylation response protein AidB-like acyl-CoA dehydrogenase
MTGAVPSLFRLTSGYAQRSPTLTNGKTPDQYRYVSHASRSGFRVAKNLDIFEGTQQIQLLIVARRLLGKTSAQLK